MEDSISSAQGLKLSHQRFDAGDRVFCKDTNMTGACPVGTVASHAGQSHAPKYFLKIDPMLLKLFVWLVAKANEHSRLSLRLPCSSLRLRQPLVYIEFTKPHGLHILPLGFSPCYNVCICLGTIPSKI